MKIFSIAISLILFIGCYTSSSTKSSQSTSTVSRTIPLQEHAVNSVLWQQRSSEYKALCYQAFYLAELKLDGILSENSETEKAFAIITDIDETLIDNSPYNAKLIETNETFSKNTWIEWGKRERATAIPGALEFLKYAESNGVQIYYISNRLIIQEKETMNNLKKLGFPFIDENHILLRDKTRDKEERRHSVMKDNNVILFLGDNLSDFSNLFDNKTSTERNKTTEQLKNKFGNKFIVLPNNVYGDWETNGIYEGKYDWSPYQKDSIRKAKLISY